MAALEADSRRYGTTGGELDFALLLDGLSAEREQGITIDVSYRYFSTARRHFIVADTPGHEQYTRNMVTGASTADCAVILLDARKGVLTQTRRHSWLVRAARHPPRRARGQQDGPRRLRRGALPRDRARVRGRRARRSSCPTCSASRSRRWRATTSSRRATARPGTTGRRCSSYLETVEVDLERMEAAPFRMPVQLVSRPSSTSAASPARSPAASCGRATRSACCRATPAARSSASSPTTATSTRRSPARR